MIGTLWSSLNFYASDFCNPPGWKTHFINHGKANAFFFFFFFFKFWLRIGSFVLHGNEYMLLAHLVDSHLILDQAFHLLFTFGD